ncbi:MAG: hypothetical protein ACRDN1_12300 [Trebonia sp.]
MVLPHGRASGGRIEPVTSLAFYPARTLACDGAQAAADYADKLGIVPVGELPDRIFCSEACGSRSLTSGKTATLRMLETRGYAVVEEAASDVVA